ncbi:MAG: YHS domain-containing protein [Candidatus Omnitrophota bacterium]
MMAAKQKMVDPVCGMKVGEDTPYKAGFHGKTYYFCNEDDKHIFQERPEVYARRAEKGEFEKGETGETSEDEPEE